MTERFTPAQIAQAILNGGLRFDHFHAPFSVYPNRPAGGRDTHGYVSVGDALRGAAAAKERAPMATFTVLDADGELVYEL